MRYNYRDRRVPSERFASIVSDPIEVEDLGMILPSLLKSATNDLVKSQGLDYRAGLDDLLDACGYSSGLGVPLTGFEDNITNEVLPYELEAQSESNLDFQRLKQITEDDSKSLPIVLLSGGYLREVYNTKGDFIPNHAAIVLGVEEGSVILYDGLQFGENSEPCEVSKSVFMKCWGEEFIGRVAYWIEINPQTKLREFDGIGTFRSSKRVLNTRRNLNSIYDNTVNPYGHFREEILRTQFLIYSLIAAAATDQGDMSSELSEREKWKIRTSLALFVGISTGLPAGIALGPAAGISAFFGAGSLLSGRISSYYQMRKSEESYDDTG